MALQTGEKKLCWSKPLEKFIRQTDRYIEISKKDCNAHFARVGLILNRI